MKTFEEFISEHYANVHTVLPEQRPGQALFNHVAIIRPDIAEVLRATPVDPFYDDNLIKPFLVYTAQLWEKT
jgi:hypothetical protein